MKVPGRLEITVAGERWRPVPTLDGCGPDDPCYVVRVGEDGAATIAFGDGKTGRRPPVGAAVKAAYRTGGTGNLPHRRSTGPLQTLLELLADMADLLASNAERIASEAFIETAGERIALTDAAAIRRAVAGLHGETEICIRLRPLRRARRARRPKQSHKVMGA